MQPAAQIHGAKAEEAAQQERIAPGAIGDFCRRVDGVQARRDERAEQNAHRQAGRQHAAGKARETARYVFGHKHPGARHFAAHGRALEDAHQEQQQRGGQADGGVGRQQADQQGRHGHHQDGQGEHALAPEQVAEVGHDDAAQRTHHVAGGEDAEGLQQTQPFRHFRREEQLADGVGKEDEDDEIVEFQRAAEGGQRQGFIVLLGEGTACGVDCGGVGSRHVSRSCVLSEIARPSIRISAV